MHGSVCSLMKQTGPNDENRHKIHVILKTQILSDLNLPGIPPGSFLIACVL